MSEKTEHIKVLSRITPMLNKNCLLTAMIFAFFTGRLHVQSFNYKN